MGSTSSGRRKYEGNRFYNMNEIETYAKEEEVNELSSEMGEG